MIIAVDHGNSAIKTEHFTFLSALEQHAKKPPMASEVLEFGGSYWTVSGQRMTSCFIDMHYVPHFLRLLTLISLGLLLNKLQSHSKEAKRF